MFSPLGNSKTLSARAVLLLVLVGLLGPTDAVSVQRSPKSSSSDNLRANVADCDNLPAFKKYRTQIQSYQADVDKILQLVQAGEAGRTYDELALFCDTFGPRMSGSKSLERAIAYMEQKMRLESRLNVSAEPAMIPKWEVYDQWAELRAPTRTKRLAVLALGSSVATNGTIEKEVLLVHSFDELEAQAKLNNVRDKIVVYNYQFKDYPTSVVYRSKGASEAAKYGAAAALVRSVTSFSIYSPHAGMASRSIPTAAITVEDADLIERMLERQSKRANSAGQRVTLRLHLDTRHFEDVKSFNLVGDIAGSERPAEVVLVSGHIDSWYNTDGAMDDGGGMMIAYRALDVLSKLGLRARRTMRAVLWTSEEFGLVGARQYFESHKAELDNFKAVIESDEGTFVPQGFGFRNLGRLGQCAMWQLLNLTQRTHAFELTSRFEGSDIELFTDKGVPGLSLLNQNSQYFYFHHTSGDSMTVEDRESLDRATALFAAATYVLAQLDLDLRT